MEKENADLIVKKSINGKGVFAKRDFIIKEVVVEIKGDLITCDVDDEIDEETRSNTYRFDKNLYISPQGQMGDFFNHSCDPNTKVIKKNKKLFLVALKPILKGDEVLFDYSTLIASDDEWEMKCNCGSENCRSIVGGFSSLPKEVKKKYMAQGVVPSYILD